MRDVLADMAGSGEIVRIRYMGGSQPGAVRDLRIIKVKGAHVMAMCLASQAPKTFRLDRIEIVDADRVGESYKRRRTAERRTRQAPPPASTLSMPEDVMVAAVRPQASLARRILAWLGWRH